jgi:hypothetical protein
MRRCNLYLVQVLGALVALAFVNDAAAFSCVGGGPDLYFLTCESGDCVGMFRTRTIRGYGCNSRIVLDEIEQSELDTLNAEFDRRHIAPQGVVKVARMFLLDIELGMERAEVIPVPGSAHTVRREWERKARDGLLGAFVERLPVWLVFLTMLSLTLLGARWVWRRAFKGDLGTSWVVAGMFLQALIVAVSRLTYIDVHDALGLWPIELVGRCAALLLSAELGALVATKWTSRSRSSDRV